MAGERVGNSLQATALVNKAYLRLIDVRRINWQNRARFLAMSARLMRRILVAVDDALEAVALNVSPETVMGDWTFAKAWLMRELGNTTATA